MYEAFFGLRERPFGESPRANRRFATAGQEAALQAVVQAVEHGGVATVIGSVGCGKTLFAHVLAAELQSRWRAVVLSNARLVKRRALYQAIFYSLKLPYRGRDEAELRLALLERLHERSEFPAGMALIVDDAHMLSSGVLDELRYLTDQFHDDRPLVRVVLCGSPALEEHLTDPRLEALTQRITARVGLSPWSRDETAAFVRFQLQAAGGNADSLCAAGALEAVYHATEGVPRLVGQLCEHALVLAWVAGRKQIDAALVDEAWSDLQQLPPPSTNRRFDAGESGVVEFGDWDAHPADDLAEVQSLSLRVHSAESDFEPPGPAPQIELDLTATADPFGEPFAEEEVVADAVSKLDAQSQRIRVPYVSPTNQPSTVGQRPAAEEPDVSTRKTLPWAAGSLPVAPAIDVAVDAPAIGPAAATGERAPTNTVVFDPAPLRAATEEHRKSPSSEPPAPPRLDDIDIVEPEDDVLSLQLPAARPAAVGGSQKSYSRLFSTLRRGTR